MHFLKSCLKGMFLLLISLKVTAETHTCPEYLRRLPTRHLGSFSICNVYERYQQLREQWQQQNQSDSQQIVGLLAPRFINHADWMHANAKGNFNPRTIYNPQPRTWERWDIAASLILQQAHSNINSQNIAPIAPSFIAELHSLALMGLSSEAGSFRKGNELGLILDRTKGLKDDQILKLLAFNSMPTGIRPAGTPLLKWQTTICWEEQTPEIRGQINEKNRLHQVWFNPKEWPAPSSNQNYLNPQIQIQHCGYISYPAADSINPELQRWSETLQSHTAHWYIGDFKEDPIYTIGQTQSWLVKIHPFVDGNGRISRLIMDLLLESLELPTPLLSDMDNDLYLSESEWATEIGAGILRHLDVLEDCLVHPSKPQCRPLTLIKGASR